MSNKVGIFMFGVDVGWQHETHAVQLVTGGGVLNKEKGRGEAQGFCGVSS